MTRLGVVLLVVLVTVVGVRAAQAGPADGDPAFGPGGVRLLDSAFPTTEFNALTVRADGRVLAAGAAFGGTAELGVPLVARFALDGALDDSVFGGDGVATTPAATNTANVARDVAFAGDGALLAGESSFTSLSSGTTVSLLLERLKLDGTLDPAFNPAGTPAGRLTTTLGTGEAGARALHPLADGRILVAGFAQSGGERRALVARFLSDGSLDPTFSADRGTPGFMVLPRAGSSVFNGLAVDSLGRIVAAGTHTQGTTAPQSYALVARLSDTGVLDPTFGPNAVVPGAVTLAPAVGASTSVAELALDGDRPVVVGATDLTGPGHQLFVARLTTTGVPDEEFSAGAPAGMLTQTPPSAAGSAGTGVTIDAEGRVTVAGHATVGGLRRLILARYTATGEPDPTFSPTGNLVVHAIGSGSLLEAGPAALGDAGKVLVAGQASADDATSKAFAARFGTPGLAPVAQFTAEWPEAHPGVPKKVVRPGQLVVFDSAGSSDADGSIAEREWDLDGDGTFETVGGTVQTHKYLADGDYGVALRITDDSGLTGLFTLPVRVRTNVLPTAVPGVADANRQTPRPQPMVTPLDAFSSGTGAELIDPTSREFAPMIGRRYAFTGDPSFDHDGEVIRFRWALDVDGKFTDWSADPEIEHVFWVPGRRTIRLQVLDDEGAIGTWEREIDIPAPAYSLKLYTPLGDPHPGLVLKPGGGAGRLVARVEATHNGWIEGLKAPHVTSANGGTIEGLKSTLVGASPGLWTYDVAFAAGTPYTSAKLRFSAVVPGTFTPESTDRHPNTTFKTITRELPVVNVPATQLAINGLEVTQGTQKYDPDYRWFHALGSRTDPMPYHGVKLAEDKETYVRLHVGNQFPETVKGVTAVLYGTRGGKPLPGSPLSPIYEPEGGVKHRSLTGTAEELDDTKASFWFRLPLAWEKRKTKIDLRGVITPPYDEGVGASCPAAGCATDNDLTVTGVPFRATPKLKLRFLKFKRGGKSPDVPGAQIILGSHQYPIDPARVEYAGGNLSVDASDIFEKKDETIVAQLHKIVREVAEDQTDDPTIHPHGIIVGLTTMSGRSRATLALPGEIPGRMTLADQGRAFAHELGHVFAQEHASGCVIRDGKRVMAPPGDDVYPVADWPPDQMGYLQGYAYPGLRYTQYYGFTHSGGVLRSRPDAPKHDLMSYCAGAGDDTALSPRNWAIISDVMQLLELRTYDVTPASEYTPAAGIARARAHAHGAKAAPMLFERGERAGGTEVRGQSIGVLGTVRSDGGIVGLSTFPLAPGHKPPTKVDPAYAAVARSADGAIVGRAPVEVVDETAHDEGKRSELRAVVPAADAARVEIVRDGVVVASAAASAAAPSVKVLSPRPGAKLPRKGSVKVRIAIADADGTPVTAKVDWAPDGRRFRTLHLGEHAPGTVTLSVPAADFAGARAGALRARVDDGFRSGAATVKRLRAPGARPQVTVHGAPFDGPAGSTVTLRATATDDRGRRLTGRALEWRLRGRRAGRGAILNLRSLRAGRHSVVLRARDRDGRTTTKRVKLRVRPATPAFVDLRVPARAAAGARFVTVRASTTVPATLTAGGKRYATSRRARSYRVRVRPGRGPLTLVLKLRSGPRRTTVRRLVTR